MILGKDQNLENLPPPTKTDLFPAASASKKNSRRRGVTPAAHSYSYYVAFSNFVNLVDEDRQWG